MPANSGFAEFGDSHGSIVVSSQHIHGRHITDGAMQAHIVVVIDVLLNQPFGRQREIQAARDRKLEEARQKRQLRRRAAA